MNSINITQARSNLYKLVADVNRDSVPITITNNKGKNGVLISEDDWNAIQETLFINSIPGMADSIIATAGETDGSIYSPDEEW